MQFREMFSRTDRDGVTITYYTNETNSVIWSESSYPRNFKSLEEELEQENKNLPKHKRKYIDESGKIISYLTAKKQGIVV